MDGVYNSKHRKIFLLTTNQLYINDNLIGRPSRIRYKKTFGNLSAETIKSYLGDNLIDKSKSNQIFRICRFLIYIYYRHSKIYCRGDKYT